MIAVVCVDDRGGMLFHGRRQSQDRALRVDLLRLCGGAPLWMNPYSAELFAGWEDRIQVDELFLSRAAPGDYCFVENRHLRQFSDRLEELVIYRWNRVYPTDFHLDLDPTALGLKLTQSVDLAGTSHERITRELYERGKQREE